ncbi:Sulfate permease family protein [Burkholderia sp. D7]|nr:Sulfate permease family protein [Burkholderia sp. D7]
MVAAPVSVKALSKRAMRLNVLKGVLPLSRAAAFRDAVAGMALASMDIPQVLGYARIAGMPAVSGLDAAFVPIVAFAVFGASRHLVVSADSATATIFANRLSSMAPIASGQYVALAGMVALLIAGLLLAARIFKLGFLADFLSRTVLIGFLAGIGVQIGVAMLGDMLGIPVPSPRTVNQLGLIFRHFSQVFLPTLGISVIVVSCILGLKLEVL